MRAFLVICIKIAGELNVSSLCSAAFHISILIPSPILDSCLDYYFISILVVAFPTRINFIFTFVETQYLSCYRGPFMIGPSYRLTRTPISSVYITLWWFAAMLTSKVVCAFAKPDCHRIGTFSHRFRQCFGCGQSSHKQNLQNIKGIRDTWQFCSNNVEYIEKIILLPISSCCEMLRVVFAKAAEGELICLCQCSFSFKGGKHAGLTSGRAPTRRTDAVTQQWKFGLTYC